MAALHARCFTRAPRPWSAAEIAGLLATGAFATVCPDGFALGRVAGPEAELLTLAVAPDARRRGCGTSLLAAFEAAARARGADDVFIEVAVDNAPARALYAAQGYAQAGLRRAYHGETDALVLRRDLRTPGPRTSS